MEVLVPIKRGFGYNATLRVKKKGAVTEITAVSLGEHKCPATLCTARAIGADQAIVAVSDVKIELLGFANLFAQIVEEESTEYGIIGNQTIDDGNNRARPMLAGLLVCSLSVFASKGEIAGNRVTVTGGVDRTSKPDGLKLPAIVNTDLRLNESRHASLPNIMKAKSNQSWCTGRAKRITPSHFASPRSTRLALTATWPSSENPRSVPGGPRPSSAQKSPSSSATNPTKSYDR